jgi:hypothetical protein
MHMKMRMTLTIEPEISHRAKAFARSKGTSLSGLVESLLAREAGIVTSEKTISFGKKWAGRLQLATKNEARFDSLKERYGL